MAEGGPRWIKEIGVVILWAVSAGNVFVYTTRTISKMYKRPPLSAWQGATASQSKDGGKSKSKVKGESFLDEALKAGAGLLAKEVNPLGNIEGAVEGIEGIIP